MLGLVNEDSPAYECGVRSGDVIVTVNDWLITVMDRPQARIFVDFFTLCLRFRFIIALNYPSLT